MAARKPLVIDATGELQELQAGDTLDAVVAEVDVITLENANASPITIGQPVYISANDTCDLSQANAASTSKVIGLVRSASIASAATGEVQTNGSLTSTDWTAVVGAVTLTAGQQYYLSNTTAGELLSTAPGGNPNSRTRVGIAISTTTMQIRIEPPILRG